MSDPIITSGHGWKLKVVPDLPRLREYSTACCVYSIDCAANSMRYIGSTKQLWDRMKNHFSHLAIGDHINSNMQAAFNQYGLSSFNWSVVELCRLHNLEEREQYWIDVAPEGSLFNIAPKVSRNYAILTLTKAKAREYMSILGLERLVDNHLQMEWHLVSDLALRTEYDYWYQIRINQVPYAIGGKFLNHTDPRLQAIPF